MFHCVKFAALGHADSFVSPIRLFHESWGMESSSTASPGAICLDFVTDEILSEGNANEAPPSRFKIDGAISHSKKRKITDPYADSESDGDSVQSDDMSDGEIYQKNYARPLIHLMIMMIIVNPSGLIRGMSVLKENWTIVKKSMGEILYNSP